ncbi:MAG: GNAT family N-acetyltransferase, partial [Pseudomonadota bacterium]
FQVTLEGGIDAILSRSNGKRRRKKLRTSERRLDELGGYNYVRAKSPEDARDLLNAFFAQKAARFDYHGLPNAFGEERTKAVFHRLAQESLNLQRKTIELHAIRLRQMDGFVCAVAAVSRKGKEAICQFSSIAMGKTEHASPGELLFYLAIQDACDTGAQVFDFGIGDAQFKRSWCDVETRHFDTIIATTLWGRLGAKKARMTTTLKRFIKNRPTTFKMAKAMRRWVSPKRG